MRFIAQERDSFSSARGENHITASVVARAAAAMPHFDGGFYYFTVEQPVDVAGCSSSVQSNNRFDVSVYHQSARAAASPPQNHQPAEPEPTPQNHQLAEPEPTPQNHQPAEPEPTPQNHRSPIRGGDGFVAR